MVKVTINGKEIDVPPKTTILEACRQAGIYVPTLCNHPDIPPACECRLCLVKINGKDYRLACSTRVTAGMVIETNTPDVKEKVQANFAQFNDMPLMPSCPEIEDVMAYLTEKKPYRTRKAEKTNALMFNPKLCINCSRCERCCTDIQDISAFDNDEPLAENECISCGQCTKVCPTGALEANDSIPDILRALATKKVLVLQTAPSVRVSAGEMFGDPIGTLVTGKVIDAAKKMGFEYVFDTNFGADATIVEEGTELIQRIQNKGTMPMFTSCCPAWVNFVERLHPELIPNLSTARSPHMMAGSIIKTYWAEKMKIDPSRIFSVSLMPCTAKKDEIKRKQMPDVVDAVITVREFAKMVKMFGIEWSDLDNNTKFDSLLGESTGAAALFGVTGGVMEAALRYAHEELTHEKLGKVEYTQWRGFKGIKTATTKINDVELKIAVCNGISNAKELIESDEWKEFSFIEVMACPCGCIGGGGQPKTYSRKDVELRAQTIYQLDKNSNKQTSNDNTELKTVYETFMGKPCGEKAHKLLHTSYEMQTSPYLEELRKKSK